jgi:uncharacterized protein YjiK
MRHKSVRYIFLKDRQSGFKRLGRGPLSENFIMKSSETPQRHRQHEIIAILITATLFSAMMSESHAKSVAASLSSYRKEVSVSPIAGISTTNLSGIALDRKGGKLYAVDNATANIYELTLAGTVVRTITTKNITDPEGICHLRDNTYIIAEEGLATLLRVEMPPSGTNSLDGATVPSFQIGPNMANTGIEGVAYCAADKTLYAVKETSPSRIYRITLKDDSGFLTSYTNDPFNIETHDGDAADVAALNDGNIIIVNQMRNRLEGYDPAGNQLSTLSLGMTQPEGIAVDSVDGTLYIAGEPKEFCVFKPTTSMESGRLSTMPIVPIRVAATGRVNTPVAITFSLASRTVVAIDAFLIDGSRVNMYRSVLGPGMHRLTPPLNPGSRGVRIYRISIGNSVQQFAGTLI